MDLPARGPRAREHGVKYATHAEAHVIDKSIPALGFVPLVVRHPDHVPPYDLDPVVFATRGERDAVSEVDGPWVD
jgi:hypothetical protein